MQSKRVFWQYEVEGERDIEKEVDKLIMETADDYKQQADITNKAVRLVSNFNTSNLLSNSIWRNQWIINVQSITKDIKTIYLKTFYVCNNYSIHKVCNDHHATHGNSVIEIKIKTAQNLCLHLRNFDNIHLFLGKEFNK